MKDFSTLSTKVSDLKAKVEQSSISPKYLGAILDDFISGLQSIDMTDLTDDIRAAITNAQSALTIANQSLSTATAAKETASTAKTTADAATITADSASKTSSSAVSTATAAKSTAEDAAENATAAKSVAEAAATALDALKAAIAECVSTKSMHLDGIEVSSLGVYEFHGIEASVPVPDAAINDTDKGSPKTKDGGNCDIVFVRSLKRFVALDEGACYVRFETDECYNTIEDDTPKTAREDRVWRYGNKLYRYDGSTLVCDADDLKDEFSGVNERVGDAEVLIEANADAVAEVQAKLTPLALPKIECQVRQSPDGSMPGDIRLYVHNAAQYLAAGYVPVLFRKTSERVRRRDIDEAPHLLRKGWRAVGGQDIVKIDSDGVLMMTDARRAIWNDNDDRTKWTYHSDKPELYANPHAIVYGLNQDGYNAGDMIVTWGKNKITIWDADAKAFQVRTLRFRFAVGFVKPYKQWQWYVTAKDCVSNLAEFAVVWNLPSRGVDGKEKALRGWSFSI